MGKLEISKNGKMIIIIINCYNCLRKPRKFSRSRMTKQTGPLNSSHKSSDPKKFCRILRQSEFFYDFLGDKKISRDEIFTKLSDARNSLS